MIDIDKLYKDYLFTPVDYGQGPRLQMREQTIKKFLAFEPEHDGTGFIGRVPWTEMFFASDHHFGHKNIIRYANRPFGSTEEMNECMVERHNSVVGKEDYCIFGGDIGFGSTTATNEYLKRMNGYKIFILGNHDFERKTGKVRDYAVTEKWLWWNTYVKDQEFEMIFSHYPLDGLPNNIHNVHGHIHDNESPSKYHTNVCVEQIDYTPIRMDVLIEQIKEQRNAT